MHGSNDLVKMGVGLLITVIVITAAISITNKGKSIFNQGNDGLTSAVANLSSTQYDLYDGSRLLGSEVISLINTTVRDKNIEILVCTKDGKNYVYNTNGITIFGATNGVLVFDESSNNFLTGLVVTDATGKSFQSGDAKVSTAPYGTDTSSLITSSGYNTSVDMLTSGYISSSSFFSSSIQKDVNGSVRRITCVQQ